MSKDIIKQLKNHLEILKASGVDLIAVDAQCHPEAKPKDLRTVSKQDEDSPLLPELRMTTAKDSLIKLRETVVRCTKCSELAATRKSVVFGSGNANAKLVFVGEAPGHDEDIQGLPFVGRAGQLLTKMIESIGLTRQQVFICNVLKCRPPGNRNPLPNEITNCEPYLFEQLDILKPIVICALGTFAAQTLLKTNATISSLRGRFHDYRGAKLICSFHPAYLLRNPNDKRKAWEDLKMIRAELNKAEV